MLSIDCVYRATLPFHLLEGLPKSVPWHIGRMRGPARAPALDRANSHAQKPTTIDIYILAKPTFIDNYVYVETLPH